MNYLNLLDAITSLAEALRSQSSDTIGENVHRALANLTMSLRESETECQYWKDALKRDFEMQSRQIDIIVRERNKMREDRDIAIAALDTTAKDRDILMSKCASLQAELVAAKSAIDAITRDLAAMSAMLDEASAEREALEAKRESACCERNIAEEQLSKEKRFSARLIEILGTAIACLREGSLTSEAKVVEQIMKLEIKQMKYS